jgi:hypothetical protein
VRPGFGDHPRGVRPEPGVVGDRWSGHRDRPRLRGERRGPRAVGRRRTFEFTGTDEGRYQAAVPGPDVEANVAWTAGMCSRYRGEVVVPETTVDSRGEWVAAT